MGLFRMPVLALALGVAALTVDAVVASTVESSSVNPFDCTFAASYPRQYVAHYTSKPLVIDGALDDPAWLAVPFTAPFVDISTDTAPRFHTHAKIRWDSSFLYVGAELEDTAVWANISSTCHCVDPNADQVM